MIKLTCNSSKIVQHVQASSAGKPQPTDSRFDDSLKF